MAQPFSHAAAARRRARQLRLARRRPAAAALHRGPDGRRRAADGRADSTRTPSTSSPTTTTSEHAARRPARRLPEPAGQRRQPASPSAWPRTWRRTTSSRSSRAARHLIAHPDADLDDLMRFVPGPDLPTGGTDRRPRRHPGRLRDRPRHLQDPRHGRASRTSRRAARASSSPSCPTSSAPRRSSRRSRTWCRRRSSQGIADVKDLTDRQHGLRLVIEIKNGFNPEAVLEQLYRLTPMEDSFGINNVALVDGQPLHARPARSCCEVYVDHRIDVVTRRTRVPAAPSAQDRLHLVEGLLVAHRRHRRGHPDHPRQRRRRAGQGAA